MKSERPLCPECVERERAWSDYCLDINGARKRCGLPLTCECPMVVCTHDEHVQGDSDA